MTRAGALLISVVALFVQVLAVPVMAGGLVEEEVFLPAQFPGLFGPRTLNLEALIVRPDTPGRHPLVVINHGQTDEAASRMSKNPRYMAAQARDFAHRGWVALVLMRRSYGRSEGEYAELMSGTCIAPDFTSTGRAAAEDIREAIRLMRDKPYVDGSKVVSVGHSGGGFASLALAADPPSGLTAVINFAGGRRPNIICGGTALINTFASFGERTQVPTLWVYAENDTYFPPRTARQFYQAFTAAGGRADLVMAPNFGTEGHFLFTRGIPQWTGYVDEFLAKWNMKPEIGTAMTTAQTEGQNHAE